MLKRLIQHRLFKNTSALLIVQLMTYVAPFIVLPYLSRILGADGFGLMVAALSLTTLANIVTDFGFNLSATYLISRKQSDSRYISRVISSIYLLKIGLIGIVFMLLGVYLIFFVRYTPVALIAIFSTVFFQAFQSTWLFQGIEKMKHMTYSTIVARFSYVIFIFLFVKESHQYDIALLCHAASTILAVLFANILIYREGFRLTRPSLRLIKLTLGHSSQFFLSRLALSASSSLSVIVLSNSVAPAQVGLYGASERLYGAFKRLINPFSQALYPYMANTGNIKLLLRFIIIIAGIMFIPALIGFIFAEDVLRIIFGAEFIASKTILRIFIISGYVAFFSICFGYPAFAGLKRVDLANKSVIISGSCQILFLLMLLISNQISPTTIACSILITEMITLFLRFTWFIKITNTVENPVR